MPNTFPLLAKTFTGIENTLAAELTTLGAHDVVAGRRMVSFAGDQELLYRANIWCRTAVRILKPIAEFALEPDPDDPYRALYAAVQTIDWSAHLDPAGSLAIDPVVHSAVLTNSLYASQVAKDALCDWFRDRCGRRPDVERHQPDLRINLHVDQLRLTVYLDASGDSLHKRGYRRGKNEAPLNEVLAAGILRLTEWDRVSPLVDFMCGSGTLPIEAALWARNIAPGLLREQFGYERWLDFDATLHARLLDEARGARRSEALPPIVGSDLDPEVLAAARENAARAGVADDVRFEQANFEDARPPAPHGTLVVNPPYDERLRVDRIAAFYSRLGDVLKRNWGGYTAWLFSGNLEATGQIGLRTSARIRLFNGPIECRLLKFAIDERAPVENSGEPATAAGEFSQDAPDDAFDERVATEAPRGGTVSAQSSVELLRGRLNRMGRHWDRWARRQGIRCYRVYDRDIPEIPLSIDRYEDQLHIVEHARPHAHSGIEHQAWFEALVSLAAEVLAVPRERVWAHAREARERDAPRDDSARRGARRLDPAPLVVHEGPAALEVRLWSSGETGLPLAERTLRQLLAAEAPGRRFLNLFGRCGAASVAVAQAGATASVTLESHKQAVSWSRRNLESNGLQALDHAVVEADPLTWLDNMQTLSARSQGPEPFDLALVAPPAGFHRRGDEAGWDPRDEYSRLIAGALALLAPGGQLYFVSAVRRYKLDPADFPQASVRDVSRQTTPPDFQAKPLLRVWSLRSIEK